MEQKLAGKIALVTGASKGIGRAIAIEMARNGADVVVNYSRSAGDANSAVAEIESLGRRAIAAQCDVGSRSQVEHLFDVALKTFGRLDVLVNNAAYSVRKPLLDLEVSDVERTWAVSQWGVFHCSQLAARQMVKQGGGNIIVVSSIHSFRPYPNATAYNAAKAAVNHMAATWAVELAPNKIRVNVLEPGWTDTPGERVFYTEDFIAEEGKKLPLGRLATAEEVAKAAVYLASGDAAYVTGAVLRIDGGFSLTR